MATTTNCINNETDSPETISQINDEQCTPSSKTDALSVESSFVIVENNDYKMSSQFKIDPISGSGDNTSKMNKRSGFSNRRSKNIKRL